MQYKYKLKKSTLGRGCNELNRHKVIRVDLMRAEISLVFSDLWVALNETGTGHIHYFS